jgi:hypothetical protein
VTITAAALDAQQKLLEAAVTAQTEAVRLKAAEDAEVARLKAEGAEAAAEKRKGAYDAWEAEQGAAHYEAARRKDMPLDSLATPATEPVRDAEDAIIASQSATPTSLDTSRIEEIDFGRRRRGY